VFRLACTVPPKARPAGDAGTVAGSGLTGTPARPKNAPDGDADSAGVPGHQVRRLPHLDLALGTRHRAGGRSRSAVGYQLRSPASLVSPVRGRMKAESRQQPGEASARRHPLTGIVPVIEITALRGHIMAGSARHRAAASATRLPTISADIACQVAFSVNYSP